MPSPPCPNCDWSHARLLELSAHLALNYYRCGSCGHSWTASKDGNALLHNVTAPTRPAKASLPSAAHRRVKSSTSKP
jgi:hypothetical protein